MTLTHAIVDGDAFKYSIAHAVSGKRIKCVHLPSGDEHTFKNITEFRGTKNKLGGFLLKWQLEHPDDPRPVSEWEEQIIWNPEPESVWTNTAYFHVRSELKKHGIKSHQFFFGKGQSFRTERSTILEYKGNRADQVKPILLDEVTDYLVKNFKGEYVEGIEADDRCVMEAVANRNSFILGEDKDYYGCPVKFLNIRKPEEGIVDCRGFGNLWRNDKGDIRGKGRMWFYHQVCSGDSIDNYKANSASDVKWAEVSSYNALNAAQSDTEAFEAMVRVFQTLYPEPKVVIGWRGDEILVDWKYMLCENFDLARMLRHENDNVNILEVMQSKGVI